MQHENEIEEISWRDFQKETYLRTLVNLALLMFVLCLVAYFMLYIGLGVIPISIHFEFELMVTVILIELSLVLFLLFILLLIFRTGWNASKIRAEIKKESKEIREREVKT